MRIKKKIIILILGLIGAFISYIVFEAQIRIFLDWGNPFWDIRDEISTYEILIGNRNISVFGVCIIGLMLLLEYIDDS